jgi:hypothetical protein
MLGFAYVRRKIFSFVTHRHECPQLLVVHIQLWADTEFRCGGVNFAAHNINDESLALRSHQLALDVPEFRSSRQNFTPQISFVWGRDLPKLVRGIGRFLRVDNKERPRNILAPFHVDDEALTRFGHQQALEEIIILRPRRHEVPELVIRTARLRVDIEVRTGNVFVSEDIDV